MKASTYLNHLDPECLRYYYAAKLNNRIDDLDLNLEDFTQRVNADVVNKIVNLASRNAGFITNVLMASCLHTLRSLSCTLNLLAQPIVLLSCLKHVSLVVPSVKLLHWQIKPTSMWMKKPLGLSRNKKAKTKHCKTSVR